MSFRRTPGIKGDMILYRYCAQSARCMHEEHDLCRHLFAIFSWSRMCWKGWGPLSSVCWPLGAQLQLLVTFQMEFNLHRYQVTSWDSYRGNPTILLQIGCDKTVGHRNYVFPTNPTWLWCNLCAVSWNNQSNNNIKKWLLFVTVLGILLEHFKLTVSKSSGWLWFLNLKNKPSVIYTYPFLRLPFPPLSNLGQKKGKV